MTAVEELRELCENLRIKRKEELKSILNEYFEATFILPHKPWRAVVGNKKCRPIPIYRDFGFPEYGDFFKIQWPNYSEETLRNVLTDLGFVVTENKICISVPAYEKGKKLTFAQEWVKKINTSYSEYCEKEKHLAKEFYQEFVSKLISTPVEKIKTCDGYTLFMDFKIEPKSSSKCASFVRKLMLRDGIEELFENGSYKGIKVST